MASPLGSNEETNIINSVTPRMTRSQVAEARAMATTATTQTHSTTTNTTTALSRRRVTPVVAVTTNNDSSSPSNVLVAPADALRLVVGAANNNKMGFPHRVLALLWYAEQTQSPWIRWTTNNEAFFLPSPDTARTSADFEQLLAAFFGKRLDLILRSISEWGFDVKLENAADPIRCQHPLVHRGMLNIQTLSTIQFSYYKRGRTRPSKSVLNGRLAGAPSAPKEMPPENKTRIQPKRGAAAPSGNQGTTTALSPRLPDLIMSPPVQSDNHGSTAIPRLLDPIMSPTTSHQTLALPMTAAPTTATTTTTTNAVTVATPNHMTLVATSSSNNKNDKSLRTFPFILARLLQELDKNHLEGLIHWNPTGTSVMLRTHHVNQEEMSRLQPYFAHGSVAIIKRQMDHYQFKKIKRQEWTEYTHQIFQRDHLVPQKLAQICRIPSPRAKAATTKQQASLASDKKQPARRGASQSGATTGTVSKVTSRSTKAKEPAKKSAKKPPVKANPVRAKPVKKLTSSRPKKSRKSQMKQPPVSATTVVAPTRRVVVTETKAPNVAASAVASLDQYQENESPMTQSAYLATTNVTTTTSPVMATIPAPITRHSSATLMDLVAAADLEEAAAVVAQAERGDMPESNHPVLQSNFPVLGSESTSYFTPEKIAPLEMTNNPSIGLTPLAETIHPTFETPGFNSVDSSAFTPGIGLY